jgi:hypothetical protein
MFSRKVYKIIKPYKLKSIMKNKNNELISDEQSISEDFYKVFQQILH